MKRICILLLFASTALAQPPRSPTAVPTETPTEAEATVTPEPTSTPEPTPQRLKKRTSQRTEAIQGVSLSARAYAQEPGAEPVIEASIRVVIVDNAGAVIEQGYPLFRDDVPQEVRDAVRQVLAWAMQDAEAGAISAPMATATPRR